MNRPGVVADLLPVLYEDEHYLAVEKPAGMFIARSGAGGSSDGGSALSTLLAQAPGRAVAASRPATLTAVEPPERLASGVMMLAKSAEAAVALAEQLATSKSRVQYVAVVRGRPRARYLARRAGRGSRTSGAKRVSSPGPGAAARAPFPLELRLATGDLSLVELETGITRETEIRLQLMHMGVPVQGDIARKRGARGHRGGRYFLHRAGVTVLHPYTRRELRIRSKPPASFEALVRGRDVTYEHLRTAMAARSAYLLGAETDCYRLLTGSFEGVAGLVAERYGPVVILTVMTGKYQGSAESQHAIGRWYVDALGIVSVYVRQSRKDRSYGGDGGVGAYLSRTPLLGSACEEEYAIEEHGFRFIVRPFHGLDMGLFPDQRENRRRVRELSGGLEVLNLFAYTCGFSVAAAAGGAASVTSVELKKSRLEWGKENFGVNNLSLDSHTFVCSEAFEYLKRARRQGRLFDLVIIDPPTFARSKKPKRTFSVVRDLEPLVRETLPVLAKSGLMLVSTNYRAAPKGWLAEQIASASEGRAYAVVGSPPLPPDFAVDRDHAKSILVRFE